jgi:NADP-dependent 3-hydroxy acid dehydrogenase YdfG
MTEGIKDKTVALTGSSSGLGQATARTLPSEATVALALSQSPEVGISEILWRTTRQEL